MSNPKGGWYERELMKHLREAGQDVERLRLSGAEDEGDLLLRLHDEMGLSRLVLEAKNRKQMNLAGWLKEAEVERDNYVKHRNLADYTKVGFAVVHKAKGKGIGRSYVTTTLDEYLEQII